MNGLRLLWHDAISRSGFLSAGVLLAVFLAGLLWRANLGSGDVPLHYNVYFGIDLFGRASSILWYFFTALGFVFVNSVMAVFLIERERTAARLLAWAAALATGLIAAGVALVLVFRT